MMKSLIGGDGEDLRSQIQKIQNTLGTAWIRGDLFCKGTSDTNAHQAARTELGSTKQRADDTVNQVVKSWK